MEEVDKRGMSDEQDGCEWVNISSATSLYPGSPLPDKLTVKRLCVA